MSFLDKAKDLLGQHDDKVDQAIDKGAEHLKGRFAGHEGQIDGLADKAKAYEWGDQPAAPSDAPADPPPSGDAPLAEAPPVGTGAEAEQPPAEESPAAGLRTQQPPAE